MQSQHGCTKKTLLSIFKEGKRSLLKLNDSEGKSQCEVTQLFSQHFPFPFSILVEQFANPIQLPHNQLGKKSNEVLFSQSMRYVLKKISQPDVEKIQKILSSYNHHIDSHTQSLLCRIHKVFGVKACGDTQRNAYYMIMESLKPGKQDISYDIKGYLDGRSVKGYSESFGKDSEFIHSQELQEFKQNSTLEERQQIIKRMQIDTQFLEEHSIMDYSIFITFGKKPPLQSHLKVRDMFVTIGIIDYLQEFNSFKKIQSRIKGWFKGDISAIGGKQYRLRLLQFLNQYFLDFKPQIQPLLTPQTETQKLENDQKS